MIKELNRDDLLDLLFEYDKYIQYANEEDLYYGGWRPVCINEFYVNDYRLIKEGDC